jgi:hypothetical protein
MLQLRPNCECCDRDLPPESTEAVICSFECTFCRSCAGGVLTETSDSVGSSFARALDHLWESRTKLQSWNFRQIPPGSSSPCGARALSSVSESRTLIQSRNRSATSGPWWSRTTPSVSRLLEWAKHQSGGSLWLHTFERNAGARAFYERYGFTIVARGFEPTWKLDDLKYEWRSSANAA